MCIRDRSFDSLVATIGFALPNIEEAPIEIMTPKLDNAFDTAAGLREKIQKHLVRELKACVLPVLGSVNFLGNPVNFFRHISNGVADLFEKPVEGFKRGALDGTVGIISGTTSLVSNTVMGTLNSLNSVTGSVANGISKLSLDDDYLRERERNKMKKPKDVMDGLGQGAKSLLEGFGKGVTGVFVQPIKGASKDGVEGFFKGTVQGFTGLFVKPLAGILDGASKATEGLKNTSKGDHAVDRKAREPRAFYGALRYYKSYNEDDAETCKVLRTYKKGRYARTDYIQAFVITSQDGHKLLLIITCEVLLLLNPIKKKLVWDMYYQNIASFEKRDHGIRFTIHQQTKRLTNKAIYLPVSDDRVINEMLRILKEIGQQQSRPLYRYFSFLKEKYLIFLFQRFFTVCSISLQNFGVYQQTIYCKMMRNEIAFLYVTRAYCSFMQM
eukprot:TRINITY_DN2668_c0_g1_i2.p1 TRINITY_DN2668_c0_g1~~TRINITY_DN2668_c0_g1_i2.p1  ORF type:complete len:440 (+),score=59.79 TRINITY_DN2668_c0_g1_i2:109-1428(+)